MLSVWLPLSVLACENWSQRVFAPGTSPDPGLPNNMHLASRVGYSKDLHDVTLSWGQKPTTFSQTERWGVAVRAINGQASKRGRGMSCRWICLCCSVHVRTMRVQKPSTTHMWDSFQVPMCTCAVWVMQCALCVCQCHHALLVREMEGSALQISRTTLQ